MPGPPASGVILEGVSPAHLDLYWPRVERWIASAVHDAGHCWTSEDVRQDLDTARMQLWVIWKDGTMRGCIVTHVFESPRGLTCAMPVVGCDDMAGCIGVLDTIEAWAKSLKCVRLQGEGRAGWERALKPRGWSKITTQVEKVLNHGL